MFLFFPSFLSKRKQVCTWMMKGKRHLSQQPYQMQFCVFAGILYGLVETLPSLAMKYDLPCQCETQEWSDFFLSHVLVEDVCISN
jgi:hypothetical protein